MKKNILAVFFITLFAVTAYSQKSSIPTPKTREDTLIRQWGEEKDSVIISGRLHSENKKQDLILRSREGDTFLLTGDKVDALKQILSDLGEKNLVTVKGYKDKTHSIKCSHSYKFDPEGAKQAETVCIRYIHLKVLEIQDQALSEEQMPEPKRDLEEEKIARESTVYKEFSQDLASSSTGMIAQMDAVISQVNLKSPIKSITVQNQDKSAPNKKLTLLLTQDTKVAKSVDREKGLGLDVKALKKGQTVMIMYSIDEFNAEALLITIKDK